MTADRESDRESEIMASIVAVCIMRRFDELMGEPVLCSPIVYDAAAQVMQVVFSSEDPIRALDELEALEAALRA